MKIQQKHVDVYKVLGVSAEEITQKCIKELEGYEADGEYPPRFRLCFFKESDSIKKKCPVKIVLHGLDPEVSISFLLNNEGMYLSSALYNNAFTLNWFSQKAEVLPWKIAIQVYRIR